jgi:hypothetical protein
VAAIRLVYIKIPQRFFSDFFKRGGGRERSKKCGWDFMGHKNQTMGDHMGWEGEDEPIWEGETIYMKS